MAQKNIKSKMVSFRLSSVEYEAALTACQLHGFKSMSLLARSAFLAFSPRPSTQASYEEDLTEIRRRLEYLTDELTRLAAIVGAPAAQGQERFSDANLATVAAP